MNFERITRVVSEWAGKPYTFAVAAGSVILWAVSGPFFGFSDTWQLVINTSTTIITFLMTFLIQGSQNHDTKAIQRKLDEIIHSEDKADDNIAGIENA